MSAETEPARFQSKVSHVALRPSAQNQEFRPLSDEKPGATFSESGLGAGFGVYVHWPYCARICPYCDFNVYRDRDRDPAPLLAAIAADIAAQRARIGPQQLESVFLGGGTPSLLGGREIAGLLGAIDRAFGIGPDVEITLEANPEDALRFTDQVAAGVNRLSLGLQALNDHDLQALGRRHDAAGGSAGVSTAAATGARVSIDLIYARQGQSLQAWAGELRRALNLPVEHLSLYQLTIEAGTAFERAVRRGALIPPGAPLAADLYGLTQELCEEAGFPAYEISNHARADKAQSRHNLVYWRSRAWIGAGPGAHGRVVLDGVRTASTAARRPGDYIARVNADGVGWANIEPLTPEEQGEEALMMGIRLSEGIARRPIEALLGRTLNSAAHVAQGLVAPDADLLRLTPAGRLLADRIALDLLG